MGGSQSLAATTRRSPTVDWTRGGSIGGVSPAVKPATGSSEKVPERPSRPAWPTTSRSSTERRLRASTNKLNGVGVVACSVTFVRVALPQRLDMRDNRELDTKFRTRAHRDVEILGVLTERDP